MEATNPQLLGMFIAWAFYLAHQSTIGVIIYCAQKDIAGFGTRAIWGLSEYSVVAVIRWAHLPQDKEVGNQNRMRQS